MKVRGSMTVFAALVFMLVASLLFALLEGTRVNTLRVYANVTSELALESVFAEYQAGLWDGYHVLGLDGAYGGTTFSEEYVTSVLNARIRTNLDLRGNGSGIMELKHCSAVPMEYQLLTDGEGRVFLHGISDCMKAKLPIAAVQSIYEGVVSAQAVGGENTTDASIWVAKQALTEQQQERQQYENHRLEQQEQEVQQSGYVISENPLDCVLAHKQNFVLGTVVENVEHLSTKRIVQTECLQNRVMEHGTSTQIPELEWYDKILAIEYVKENFSDYRSQAEEKALSYEMEYIVCGKDGDKENLEAVVERLLLAREAANVIHITFDQEKRLAVSEAALALAGATANAAVIKAVEYGLIAAWAYADSTLDVRALLCGDKVALIKNDSQWTSNLMNLSQVLESSMRAINCEEGWSYQDYLKSFLFVMTEQVLAYRMMDIMEQNIRRTYEYRNCRMDHMISSICYTIDYEADPLFWNFSILPHGDIGKLPYQTIQNFSYY